MEIKINIDIEAAIAKAISPEVIGPILDKHVTDSISSAIRDATDWNSDFRKALKDQLSEAMPHGLALDDIVKFQHVLNGAIKDAVNGANSDAVYSALIEAGKSVLPEVPTVIALSEFMQEARDGLRIAEGEAFYALYEESEYGGGHLYLDSNPRPGVSSYGSVLREGNKYSADINLAFNKEGEVYSLKFRNEHVTPSSRPTVITRLDSILMSMYVGRTKLNVDIDADDVAQTAQEQYAD